MASDDLKAKIAGVLFRDYESQVGGGRVEEFHALADAVLAVVQPEIDEARAWVAGLQERLERVEAHAARLANGAEPGSCAAFAAAEIVAALGGDPALRTPGGGSE